MQRQSGSDNRDTIVEGLAGGDRPARVPERIGAYRVEARLGLGGMGEVLLAWDERLERRVAIKRIRQEAGLTSEQRERFRREARLAARLSHSAVVQVYDLISDGPDDAIVMEYVEGRTLADRLSSERLETVEVIRLACEIAEGLAAAHEAGLVHRDLKAANVLVTPAGHAKILDFGLARPVVRALDDPGLSQQGIVLGTCHAMSPEQARGEEVDERSDLFSFGSLVHEMLTGRPPFRGNDPIDSLRRVVTEEPADPRLARPDLPAEAAHLLRRLLAKNRDDRPAGAREVIGILEGLLTVPSGLHAAVPEVSVGEIPSGDVTQLELPGTFQREKPNVWIRRLLITAAALLVAGAVALLLIDRGRPATSAAPVPRQPDPIRTIPTADGSQEDLAALPKIKQRLDNGEKQLVQDQAKLDTILQRNPRSVEALILAARVEHALYQSWRKPDFLHKALEFAQRAKALAPDDPRPRFQELYITLAANDKSRRAEALLREIEARWPWHPEILLLRASLEEQRGNWGKATELLTEAVETTPSWRNRYRLASLEARRGRIEEARKQIGIILDQEPGNLWAREQLGHLELMYGDVGRAEQIYQSLLGAEPRRALNNLGQARFFLARYQEAADAYRSALDAEPDHAPTLVNLADAEVELGQTLTAKEHYRRALELLQQQSAQSGLMGLTPREQMLAAQCLARLGEFRLAVKTARDALSKNLEEPELLEQSALVQILAGDRATALEHAQAALERGLRKRWFAGSAFRELRKKLEDAQP